MVRYLYRNGFLSTVFLIDLGLLLLIIFLFILASEYPDMARTFPRLVLMMILVVTILDMLNIIRAEKEEKPPEKISEDGEGASQGQQLRVLYMVAFMFVFFLFMILFGFVLGTLLFLLLSGWTLGYRKLKILILSSVIITVFVYTIFGFIMKSFLPEGLIFAVIGG